MKVNDVIEIGGCKIFSGETCDTKIAISETYTGDAINIPIKVMRSKKPGPVVLVTAAIHGDEINGTGIIHDLMFGKQLNLRSGTLILVPVVNVLGFENQTRYLPDRRDLNRCFPGQKRGSMASRIAWAFMKEVVTKCDYCIDLHSAAAQRTNYPNVRADMSNPEVAKLAKYFECALIVNGKGPSGAFRPEATKKGCATIILEAGESWKIEPSVLKSGVIGIKNVLKHLNMISGRVKNPPYEAIIDKTTWVRAEVGGILKFHVTPGQLVEKGQFLATNYTILGERQNTLKSPTDGIVLGMTTMPAVKPGEPVCHIAIPKAGLDSIQAGSKRSERTEDLLHQVGVDLATNVNVVEASQSNIE